MFDVAKIQASAKADALNKRSPDEFSSSPGLLISVSGF